MRTTRKYVRTTLRTSSSVAESPKQRGRKRSVKATTKKTNKLTSKVMKTRSSSQAKMIEEMPKKAGIKKRGRKPVHAETTLGQVEAVPEMI